MEDKTKTRGLEFVNENIPKVAKDLYEDDRVRKTLNTGHTPTAEDFDLINDMIEKLKKVIP